MIGRLFSIAVIIGAAYWYWTGPYQDRVNPSYEQKLERYAEEMRKCIHGVNYKAGTGANTGDPETICSDRLNLYRYEGRWHSYDDVRQQ